MSKGMGMHKHATSGRNRTNPAVAQAIQREIARIKESSDKHPAPQIYTTVEELMRIAKRK